jgi:hypothetical protein
MEKLKILDALRQLDPDNDEHWTTQGQPRLDVVGDILDATVTRAEVTAAAPEFSRDAARIPASEPESEPEPVEPVDPRVERYFEVSREIEAKQEARAKLTLEINTLTKEQHELSRFVPNRGEFDPTEDQLARMKVIRAATEASSQRASSAKLTLDALGLSAGGSLLDQAYRTQRRPAGLHQQAKPQ